MSSTIPVRLMDQKRDYVRMGTKKGQVEVWEDGKREGDVIYGFVYMGKTVRETMEHD